MSFVLSENLQRRHLTSEQRAAIALEVLPMLEEEAKRRQIEAGEKYGENYPKELDQKIDEALNRNPQALEQAAKLFHTNRQYVSDLKKIQQTASEKVEEIKSGTAKLADVKREIARKEIIENLGNIEIIQAKETEGTYDVIVIDPPWPSKKIEREERPLQSEWDYPAMTIEEIANLKIPCSCFGNCHFWKYF